jgi:beta-galactosidase
VRDEDLTRRRQSATALWRASSSERASIYLGESTPYYSARGSYLGIVDLAGFRKDRFLCTEARWRPSLPMAHILLHWTWGDERECQTTPVHILTSGDEAELFVNGEPHDRKARGDNEYSLRWE